MLPERWREFEDTYGMRVCQSYGCSEAGLMCSHRGGERKIGTVGLPLPDTSAVVVDPSRPGQVAPPGCRGRLWLRGPQLRGADWLDAGVDASLDADGYLRVHEDA